MRIWRGTFFKSFPEPSCGYSHSEAEGLALSVSRKRSESDKIVLASPAICCPHERVDPKHQGLPKEPLIWISDYPAPTGEAGYGGLSLTLPITRLAAHALVDWNHRATKAL